MRIARLDLPTGPAYARMEGDTAHTLSGAPWEAGTTEVAAIAARGARLLAPVRPGTVFAVGRNYAAHAREVGLETTSAPSVFLKRSASIIGPDEEVRLPAPQVSDRVEHEAELAVVIGTKARQVRRRDALEHVFGFTCANDVTARDLQRRDPHITRAKGFDTFCPVGPWIETDLDLARAQVICRVNAEVRQHQPVSDMLHDVTSIIVSISAWATLWPGDLILTGSPGGSARLRRGDRVEIEIDGIGTLAHRVA